MKILITRPHKQATHLATLISEQQWTPILFPTLEIVSKELSTIKQQLSGLNDEDIIIVTSANAAFAVPTHTKTVIAIGSGTANELKTLGIQSVIPRQFSSEGILSLNLLNTISDKTIYIFCGDDPREFLKKELTTRGANVIEIFCYHRQLPVYDNLPEKIIHLQKQQLDIILSTSLESLKNLVQLMPGHYSEWLKSMPLLVISATMLKYASEVGFKEVFLANASDAEIMKSLKEFFIVQKNVTP